MKGVPLCARFSIATNRLRYCGPAAAEGYLYRSIVSGAELERSGRALLQFEALEPYLRAIAAKHGRESLDEDVVEAYWIGNELLDAFTRADFLRILDAFQRRGMPRSIVERLARHLPERPVPHHAFHVTFVGVGQVSGKVPTNLENMERCRPSWGRVRAVEGRRATVEKPVLEIVRGRLRLGATRTVALDLDPAVVPGLSAGDTVAMHWDWPALVLDARRTRNLREYTRRSVEAASEGLGPMGALGTA